MDEGLDSQTKRLIERFKSRSTTSTRVLSIWVSTLLVLWLSGIEPKADAVTSYVDTHTAYSRKAELAANRKPPSTDDIDKSSKWYQERINQYESTKQKAESLKDEKATARDQALVPFELPGSIKVPVPIVWAPTVWVALAFGALVFLLIQRNALTALSARVANRLVKSPELEPILHEALADAPFWLAPVPRKAGISATPESHAAVLGWKNDHFQIGLCVLIYITLLTVQVRVAFFAFAFADVFGTLHEQWLAPLLSVAFVLASLGAIVETLMPRTLPDSLPLDSTSWFHSRRHFLASITTGVLVLSLSVIAPRLPIKGVALKPRFRRIKINPRSESLAIQSRGLHVNHRSGIAHYILDSGQILGVSKIDVKNLIPVTLKELKLPPSTPRAHISRASATFELTALEFVKKKDYQSACEALMIGIRYDRLFRAKINKNPDFRLYDLLAGLSVRHDLPTYLQYLRTQLSSAKETNQVATGSSPALYARLNKWQDLKSKWHEKWTDKSKEIIWCALPMQDTRIAGNGRSSRPRTTPFRVSV